MVDAAETERVQRCDRPSTHGKNVTENPPDAGGRALIGLDERRMIVAFHLKSHGQSVANIDHSSVLARPLQNMRAFRRQAFQIVSRALVATVLRPHDGEHAEFRMVWLSSEELDDLPVLFRGQTVTGDSLRGHKRLSEPRRFLVTHGDAPFEHTPRQWTKRFCVHPHCPNARYKHLPDEALGRKRSAFHCTRPRCYPGSHWD